MYKNPTEAFELLYQDIMNDGVDFAGTKAKFNQSFTIQNPLHKVITTPERKFNQDYAEYEWNWYREGNRDAKEIAERAKIWKQMMIPGTTEVNSNYGYFWNYNQQLKKVIKDLQLNKETRRAIVVHYLVQEMDQYKYDTPCTLSIVFCIEDDKLCMTVTMRSNDLVFGFCNDQYCFSKLQKMVALRLNKEVGWYYHFAQNLHIYEKHFKLHEREI